jgi:hypothetical protein
MMLRDPHRIGISGRQVRLEVVLDVVGGAEPVACAIPPGETGAGIPPGADAFTRARRTRRSRPAAWPPLKGVALTGARLPAR